MSTIKLTAGNDTVDVGFGLSGTVNGVSTPIVGNTIDGGTGINTMTMSYPTQDPFFQIGTSDAGIVTLTSASGAVNFVNFQKFQFSDVTFDTGSAGADKITSTSARGDVLYGFAGNDILTGGAGADSMYGGSGNDHLIATSGKSQMYGGAGNDTITSGTGTDLMSGGMGHDLFVISAHSTKDTITDFTAAGVNSDVLNLHNSGLKVASFAALHTHMAQVGANVVIHLDSTHTVTLDNVHLASLTAHDFVL